MTESPPHTLEPDLAAAAPRRVRPSARAVAVGTAALLLLLGFAACGLSALSEAVRLAVLNSRGADATATVTEVDFADVSPPARTPQDWKEDKAKSVSSIVFTFSDRNGVIHTGRVPVTVNTSPAAGSSDAKRKPVPFPYPPGAKMRIRYAFFAGHVISRAWSGSPSGKIAFLVIAGLFATGVGVFMAAKTGIWMLRAYRLVRDGTACVGTIIAKAGKFEDMTRYYITLCYADEAREPRELRIACTASHYQRVKVGQDVTIIYPAGKPDQAALYAALPFGK